MSSPLFRQMGDRPPRSRPLRLLVLLALPALPALLAGAQSGAPPKALSPIFKEATPESAPRWSGEPVTMSLRDADLVETLRSFARLGDFNLLLQPGVRGKVTVELKDVPWDQAMSVILRMHGLGMDISEGTLRIGTQAELLRMAEEEARFRRLAGSGGATLGEAARAAEPRLRVVGELRYLEAPLVVKLLEYGYLSERGVARARGATLEIEDGETRLRRVARLVAALDRPEARDDNLAALRRRATRAWPSSAER
ncbi:MAG: secretin and TonB N-terminal domain-containing protein [Acidobacteriota bacterium]